MDKQTNHKKREMPLKLIKFYKVLEVLECVITFDLFQWHFHVFFLHFSVYLLQRHVLFPFLWHLVCPSVSKALPLPPFLFTVLYKNGVEIGNSIKKTLDKKYHLSFLLHTNDLNNFLARAENPNDFKQ